MPYTGNPQYGEIPSAWRPILGPITSIGEHVPYRIRMGLVTEIGEPTVDDSIPEVKIKQRMPQMKRKSKRIQCPQQAFLSGAWNQIMIMKLDRTKEKYLN